MRTAPAAMRRSLRAVIPVLLAGACSTTTPPTMRYDLAVEAAPAKSAPAAAHAVRVDPFVAAGGRDQHELAYSTAPGRVAYYGHHRWTERPTVNAREAVVQGLLASGAFRSVSADAGETNADLVLSGRVVRFEQVFLEAPAAAEARVEITGRLSRADPCAGRASRGVAGKGRAPVSGPDGAGDRQGVADAIALALQQAVDELCAQVVEIASEMGRAPEPAGDRAIAEIDLRVSSGGAVPGLKHAVTLRVDGFTAAGGLDRLDVVQRTAGYEVVARPGVRWLRFPTEMVQAALVETLRAACGPEGRVLRPAQAGRADATVHGHLRRFEVDAAADPPAAVVEVEVDLGVESLVLAATEPIPEPCAATLAAAFQTALTRVLAGVPGFVDRVLGAEPAAAPVRTEPAEQPARLVVSLESLGKLPTAAVGRTVRVLRIGVQGDLNRVEVLRQVGDHLVEVDGAFCWNRFPGEVVTDALVDGLKRSKRFGGTVGRPSSFGQFDLEINGLVTGFHFDSRQGTEHAEVSMELEVHGPVFDDTGAAEEIVGIQAAGTAAVSGRSAEAYAVAMSQALSAAVTDAILQVGARATAPASGE